MQLNRWLNFFLKFVQYLFLESFFVSLEKSISLNCRCLMSKFSEMFILLSRKIFSAFYPILHETFSNSYSSSLIQEFNPFYPRLVLYDRKPLEQPFVFVSSKVSFGKLWCEECSYETVMFFRRSHPEVFCKKVVLRTFTKFTGKHLHQSLFINKVAVPSLSLYHY